MTGLQFILRLTDYAKPFVFGSDLVNGDVSIGQLKMVAMLLNNMHGQVQNS